MGHLELLQYLITDVHLDVNIPDNQGFSVVDHAIVNSDRDMFTVSSIPSKDIVIPFVKTVKNSVVTSMLLLYVTFKCSNKLVIFFYFNG